MAKKKQPKSGSKARGEQPKSGSKARVEQPRLHKLQRGYHTPSELLEVILKVWLRVERGDTTPERRLGIITAGMVTGAKLLIRLTSRDGSLEMMLQPTVEYSTEKASDELAQSLREQMIDLGAISREQLQLIPSAVFGEDNHKEPTIKYLRLVRERTNWRWVHPPFDPGVDADDELKSYLSPLRSVFNIAHEMVEALVEQRALVTDPKLEMISEYIAAIAAAKYCLSLWGNRARAATIEYLAEQGSEALYNKLHERA